MSNRIRINKAQPDVYKAMINLSQSSSVGLNKKHAELIKIRASQINGCAYCLNMHSADARKIGETEQRIYTLSAWRETPFFDEQEQAILALTEEVTNISNHGISEATYNAAAKLFDEQYLAQIIMSIVTINAWNRIAISTQMVPGE